MEFKFSIKRAKSFETPVNFCGEDAGKPAEAIALIAIGLRSLSMRPSSIGRVKSLIRSISIKEARSVMEEARAKGKNCAREDLINWLVRVQAPYY